MVADIPAQNTGRADHENCEEVEEGCLESSGRPLNGGRIGWLGRIDQRDDRREMVGDFGPSTWSTLSL